MKVNCVLLDNAHSPVLQKCFSILIIMIPEGTKAIHFQFTSCVKQFPHVKVSRHMMLSVLRKKKSDIMREIMRQGVSLAWPLSTQLLIMTMVLVCLCLSCCMSS